jgi:hypothetical protein
MQAGQSVQQPAEFLTQQNYNALLNYTRKTITDKEGINELPEKTERRLISVLNHYMKEVGKANPGRKIQELNREVLRETLTSIDSWLRRGGESTSTNADTFRRDDSSDRLYSNVGQQLASVQKERGLMMNAAPVIKPDFRDKVEEDDIDPLALFEKARQQREKEGMPASSTQQQQVVSAPNKKPDLVDGGRIGPRSGTVPELILRDDSPEYKIPQTLPQDIIIRQQDIVKYKEIEYNIFLNSSDRNWLLNKSENRYDFSVNFNVANNSTDFPSSPSLQERFRNITRIEFVKVIVSLEGLVPIIRRTAGPVVNTDAIVSVLSYPYVALRIAELNANGFGTNPTLDNTFAVTHQDTSWTSDTTQKNRGFASLAPKYLKCQKIYAPTPLGSLQKLSIRLERPDGLLLSDALDVQYITNIYFGNYLKTANSGADLTTVYQVGLSVNEYVFINTSAWFSRFMVSDTDRIVIKGFTVATTGSGSPDTNSLTDFTNWINRAEGHYVVGIGYASSSTNITDGQNAVGYANYVIIRNRFVDPTVGGATGRQYFGGSSGLEDSLGTRLGTQASQSGTAAFINMNHQVHVALRVVCREMDGASNLRPDNT